MSNLLNLVADDLSKGCVLTAQNHSLIMGLLPFKLTNGSMTHLYSVVDNLTATNFRGIGEDAGAVEIEPVQKVETLKIMSGDVKVDRVFQNGNVGNINDVRAEQTEIAMKSMASDFEDKFFYGTGLGHEFKGLYPRLADNIGKKFDVAITGVDPEAEMEAIEEAIDYISYNKNGKRVIVCNAKTKRVLNKLMRKSNTATNSVEMFGQTVIAYDVVVIYPSEAVKDGQIFLVNIAEADGVAGLTTNGLHAYDMGFQGVHLRTAVEMVTAIRTPHPRCFAVIESTGRSKSKR